jgi:hypothetical protein
MRVAQSSGGAMIGGWLGIAASCAPGALAACSRRPLCQRLAMHLLASLAAARHPRAASASSAASLLHAGAAALQEQVVAGIPMHRGVRGPSAEAGSQRGRSEDQSAMAAKRKNALDEHGPLHTPPSAEAPRECRGRAARSDVARRFRCDRCGVGRLACPPCMPACPPARRPPPPPPPTLTVATAAHSHRPSHRAAFLLPCAAPAAPSPASLPEHQAQ